MAIKDEKARGFIGKIKDGLSHTSHIVLANTLPKITGGAEIVMKNIDERIARVEKRIFRKISSFIIIGFGAICLIFALFFFLKESFGWGNALAFFSIGITIFVLGLILKLNASNKQE